MLRVRNWWLPLAAVALTISFMSVRAIAEDAKKDTGTISGTVTGADGNAAANVEISVFHPPAKHDKAEAKAKHDKMIPVVPMVKSDDKGAFTVTDVPAGDYLVIAKLRGQGQAREKVTVAAGETAKLDLKLAQHGGGHGAAPAGGDKPADPAK